MRKGIILATLFTACQGKHPESVSFITDPNKCWYLLRYPDQQLKNKAGYSVLGCTKFYPNQTYQSFAVTGNQLTIETPLEADLSNRGRWSFNQQDSVFTLDKSRYVVQKMAADTVNLVNEKGQVEKLVNYQSK